MSHQLPVIPVYQADGYIYIFSTEFQMTKANIMELCTFINTSIMFSVVSY